MQSTVAFDSTSLFNFATVGRVGLLVNPFRERAFIVEQVRIEIENGLPGKPDPRVYKGSEWLQLTEATGASELRLLEIYRDTVFGRDRNQGEAETLAVCKERSWRCITDDHEALEVAKQHGIQALTTANVLSWLAAMGMLSGKDAKDIATELRRRGRPVD